MNSKILKKLVAILMLLSIFLSNISNIVFASMPMSEAYIKDKGECGRHLQYWKEEIGNWSYLITHYVVYEENGKEYPAYCLEQDLHGVGDRENYSVDLTNILDDIPVWRTIINGYPYKTPSQLGVQDEYDAFAATKQAVYCVMYGWDPSSRYNGADERGNAIKNAICQMVNEGRNGSQTPYIDGITVEKVGELKDDGDYYSQEYRPVCGTDTENYTITATNGLPNGAIITDLSNSSKMTFSGGENFKVRIPKSEMGSDINAIFSLQAKAKTYPIFYGKTRIAGTQDYALTFDPYGDITGTSTLNVKTDTGKIKIVKNDAETNQPIEGVTFQLQKKDGTVIANATTNSNGEASFSKLYQGDYILKEISTNDNYILNEADFDVNVQYNQTTTKTITNEHKRGDIKVFKVDKDNNKVVLGNVEFQLYSEEFGRVIGTYRTDVNGEIKIEGLRTGNYKLIETETNRWYNLAEDTEVKVEWNNVTNATVENELKKGQIKVIKIDKDNNEVKLEGVEFEVLDENNKVLEKIVTNENGEALTSRYPVRDFSKLKLRESKTLENYVLSNEEQTITLKENQIENITFQNEKKKGQIKVIKVDLDNKEVKIPNVEFKVYDEKGNVVDTLITDEKGEAISKRLPIDQKYKVQETKTGEWYVLNDEPQTVTLKQGQITDMTFTNEKKKGQIRIIKVDLDNNEVLLEGVTFDILDEDGNVVDTVVTDEKGEATTKRLPIDQKYTAVEKKTRKEYVLTEETQTVTLKQDEITSITFENEKIKGYVQVTKVDSKTKNTLAGAEFGIYNEDDEQVGTLITDETGKAKSELLPYGKYYLKELSTGSVYYLLNENTYEFEIVKDGETVEETIENEPTDITVDDDKTGTAEIKPGEKVNYEFSNVANNSNVYLDSFKFYDFLPTDYIRLEKMTTGTWNQDLTYDVYYKTNKSEDYILFKENLSTNENYDLDFTTIEFGEDEYITETMFDFGKVEKGFREVTGPTMECKSFDTLQDGETFTNHTKTVGVYYGVTAEADSDWTTVVHVPEEKHEPVLPKTGK